jgi:serine/threonine-protein kinase SRPK3
LQAAQSSAAEDGDEGEITSQPTPADGAITGPSASKRTSEAPSNSAAPIHEAAPRPPVAGERRFVSEALTPEKMCTAPCKIVDFGNACWRSRHFTDDIQTRQYRSPEVIVGQGYDTSTDLWSLACMIFELATGDLLFDPREARDRAYSRDEDHLALMMELLGPMPVSMTLKGVHTGRYFEREGKHLKRIKQLKFWPLAAVLVEKYDMEPAEVRV